MANFQWHPLDSERRRELLLGRDPSFRHLFRLVVLADYAFPKAEDIDHRYGVSKAFDKFCTYAFWSALVSAIFLYMDWCSLALAYYGAYFGDLIGPNDRAYWFYVHVMNMGETVEDAWRTVIWSWIRAQIALRSLMLIYVHLRPATERVATRQSVLAGYGNDDEDDED